MPDNQMPNFSSMKPKSGEPEDIFDGVESVPPKKEGAQFPQAPKGYTKTAPPPSGISSVSAPMRPSSEGFNVTQRPVNPPQAQRMSTPSSTSQMPQRTPPAQAPATAQPFQQKKEPVDIFSNTDTTTPKVRMPVGPANPERPGLPHGLEIKSSAPDLSQDITDETERRKPLLKSKIFIIIALVFVSGGLVAAGYFAYQQISTRTADSENVNADIVNSDNPSANTQVNTQPIQTPTPENTVTQTPTPTPSVDENIDTDLDGVTDREEKLYGTNISSPDTDSDGLTDRDETKTYLTDPLNPDTDGDGYKDGDEVNNRYNPKGAGKLFENAQ